MNCPICLESVGIIHSTSPCSCKIKYHRKCYNLMKNNNNINCSWCRTKLVNTNVNILNNLKFVFLPYFFSNNYKKSYILLFFDTFLVCELFQNIFEIVMKKVMIYNIVITTLLLSKNYIIDKYFNVNN